MFPNISAAKLFALFYLFAAVSAIPIFFGHPKQTNIFITHRMDTVATTANQIPLVGKPQPNIPIQQIPQQITQQSLPQPIPSPIITNIPVASQTIQISPTSNVKVASQSVIQSIQQPLLQTQAIQPAPPTPVTIKVPIPIPHPSGAASNSPADMNKLFNEMKNSKKPYMTIKMKTPKKSLLSEALDFFTNNESEHIVVHVPYNVHTHNIHHHHIQPYPVIKHVPIVKHVPVVKEYVKEVAIPVHLPAYHGWSSPATSQWSSPAASQWW